ncbi:MAG: lysophospholipid acyltransferase family protein [Flavobacteriales bacterium]
MKHLLAPIYFVYKLWIGLIFWSTLLLMYPFFLVLLSKKKWFGAAFRMKVWWSRLFQVLLFCPVKRELHSDFPKGPYVVVSNHSSYLDTVFMYSVVPDYFLFIGKGELLKWPLFGLFFRKQDIPVHRESSRKAYEALHKAYEAIDRGESIAMYPEGTIPAHAPRMKAFKNGAFKMAIDKQVPIVPITFPNNYKIMLEPSHFWEYSLPHVVRAVVHAPIDTKGMTENDIAELRKRVFAQIEEGFQ